MQIHKYNEEISEASMASFLGEKIVTPYIMSVSYLALNNPDSALKISENTTDDPLMFYISLASYMLKYSSSSDPNHLIMAASYFKLITPEIMNKKYDNKMIEEMINNSLKKVSFDKTNSMIKLMVEKNLNQKQQSEIDATAVMIKRK
jgi:hypothetical protein